MMTDKENRELFFRIFGYYLVDEISIEILLTQESHKWMENKWITVKQNHPLPNSMIVELTELGKEILAFNEL